MEIAGTAMALCLARRSFVATPMRYAVPRRGASWSRAVESRQKTPWPWGVSVGLTRLAVFRDGKRPGCRDKEDGDGAETIRFGDKLDQAPCHNGDMHVPGLDFALEKAWERWVLRGRRPVGRPLSGEPGWVLAYTARYRVSITLIFLLFSSLYSYMFFVNDLFADDPDWKRWGIKTGSVFLWALVTAVFLSMLVERVTVTERGITRRSWRGTQSLDWPAIVQIEAKPAEGILVLGGATSRISVSLYLDGLLSMMPFLERHYGSELSNAIGFVLPRAA